MQELGVTYSILCVDVAGFGDQSRTNRDQLEVRDALYRALKWAFDRSGVPWDRCHREDRGDGALILIPADVRKGWLASPLPHKLAAAILKHNERAGRAAAIRLRMAIDSGQVHHDQYGVTGTAINRTFRMLNSLALYDALRASPGVLALIVRDDFYQDVIRNDAAAEAVTYRRVPVAVKETELDGWICLPDHPYEPIDVVEARLAHARAHLPRRRYDSVRRIHPASRPYAS